MASNPTLKAQPRTDVGKNANRKMRAAGRVPAVVYGHGEDTRLLSVDAHELDLLFQHVHWENTLISLDIEGEKQPVRTLIKEVQAHPHRPFTFHVDFQQIHAGEMLHIEVPIRLIGNAPGVKNGGVLTHTVTDLEVRCTPDRIPEFIDVDVSKLEIGDSIHLSDITLPEGVTAEIDAERTLCSVTAPTVSATSTAEGDEAEDEAEGAEPEVIGRGGEDEDESED